MMYNKTVQDCFFSPRHVGSLDLSQDFTVLYKNSQKDQGIIEFYLQCAQDGVIKRACFKSNGNPYVIAGLEWLCRRLEGKVINSLMPIDYQVLSNELGIPVAQYPVALRIVDVYQEVIYLMKKKYP